MGSALQRCKDCPRITGGAQSAQKVSSVIFGKMTKMTDQLFVILESAFQPLRLSFFAVTVDALGFESEAPRARRPYPIALLRRNWDHIVLK